MHKVVYDMSWDDKPAIRIGIVCQPAVQETTFAPAKMTEAIFIQESSLINAGMQWNAIDWRDQRYMQYQKHARRSWARNLPIWCSAGMVWVDQEFGLVILFL